MGFRRSLQDVEEDFEEPAPVTESRGVPVVFVKDDAPFRKGERLTVTLAEAAKFVDRQGVAERG